MSATRTKRTGREAEALVLSDTTPAMAAGVTDHAWKLEEIVGLLDHANAA